jgi:deoxyribonuclease V
LQRKNLLPSLLVIDGHGIAHPRGLGIACWVGLKTNLPSIGIAKRPLLHYAGDLEENRGAQLPIWHNNKIVGHALRTQDSIKPIYISPGYRVSIQQATDIALALSPNYRLAEPIRTADHIARAFAKGEAVNAVVL